MLWRCRLDPVKGIVYTEGAGGYYEAVGRLNAHRKIEFRAQNSASEIFNKLDAYLRTNQVNLPGQDSYQIFSSSDPSLDI